MRLAERDATTRFNRICLLATLAVPGPVSPAFLDADPKVKAEVAQGRLTSLRTLTPCERYMNLADSEAFAHSHTLCVLLWTDTSC